MPHFRQRFTGLTEEDFPEPPIARRLQPGDIVEYDADEPVEHARLELLTGGVVSGPVETTVGEAGAEQPQRPSKTRKAAAEKEE